MDNWFSNFLPFDVPMPYAGMTFGCVETFYQAMKTLDKDARKRISLVSAAESKKLGRTVTLRPDWEAIKDSVMIWALEYKFGPNTTWRAKLLATTEELVEWNYWHDQYWGQCTCDKHKHVAGQNRLGKLLMELRTRIQATP